MNGLAKEEHLLYSKENLNEEEQRLEKIGVDLDPCWDLLRQRRGLRDAHANPDIAKVRPANVFEKDEQ